MYLKLASKIWCHMSQTYKDMTIYPHMYQNVYGNWLQKNVTIQEWPLYKRLLLEKYSECFFMFGVILKATNSSFVKVCHFDVVNM